MAELVPAPLPPRAQLLEQLCAGLDRLDPTLRLLARGVLGADAPIDLVAVDAAGRSVLILVGGPGEDLELVARGLAQRAWLEPRLADWLQLAPNLGLRPEARARLVLLCPEFGPSARSAARAADPEHLSLATFRCLRNGGEALVLIEPLGAAAARSPGGAPAAGFRTGLREIDLGLTPEERREFDSPPAGSTFRGSSDNF